MQKYKIGNVKVEELTTNVLKLTSPWWFQPLNLSKALVEVSKVNKIKTVVKFYRTWLPTYLLVFTED